MPSAGHRGASASPTSSRARPHGFPRACRLLRRADYDPVYRDGQRRTSRHFTVFCRASGAAHSRLGISVKRALGGAVVRNRMRRRLREMFRTHRQEIPAGWDIVIHPRNNAVATAEFSALTAELLSLLRPLLA